MTDPAFLLVGLFCVLWAAAIAVVASTPDDGEDDGYD